MSVLRGVMMVDYELIIGRIEDDLKDLKEIILNLRCEIGQKEDEIINLQNQVEHWQEEYNKKGG
jgi:plasmid maintenance system antidote protein VapI